MTKYITFSKTNKYFIYLLLSSIFDVLKDSLYGLNHNEGFKVVKLYNDKVQDELSKHKVIHNIFNYIGTLLFAFICFNIETSYYKDGSSKNKEKIDYPILLIHNNDGEKDFKSKKSFYFFLFIITIWILEENLIKIHIEILQDLDFWMIEILIISFLMTKMFKLEIFKHQIIAMSINIIPCLLKIGSIILSFYDDSYDKDNYTGKLPIFYIKSSFIIIPLGIIIYLCLISLRALVNSNLKWYMDLKYVSSNKLLMYYGGIGVIICSFICIISTFIECENIYNIEKHNKTIHFSDYICKIKYDTNFRNISNLDNGSNETHILNYLEIVNMINIENISNNKSNNSNIIEIFDRTYFFDNFLLYFKRLKGIEILKEFSIIILGMITFFFNKFFSILVIKYLTPVYITFSIPIIYIIQKLVMLLNTLIWEHKIFNTEDQYKYTKFFLDITGDFFSVLGFLIYLEIIVLNFCKYDYNIKKNIIRRSFGESYGINKKGINENEDENEKEDNSFSSEDVEQDESQDLVYSYK